MLQETQFLTAFQDMRYASVRESQEKKKKKVEFVCEVWKHNEDLQIFKYSVCTGLEECSSAGQADRHTSQQK